MSLQEKRSYPLMLLKCVRIKCIPDNYRYSNMILYSINGTDGASA